MADFGYSYPTGWGPGPDPAGRSGGSSPYRKRASYDSSPHSFDSIAHQNDALSYWNQVNEANKAKQAQDYWHAVAQQQQQAPAPGGPGAPGTAGGGAAGGPPMDSFGAAIAHVNQQFDAQLQNLDRLTGSAKTGTQNVGNETMSRLAALGKDAQKQNKASNKNVRNEFAAAKGQQGAVYAALLADLVRQGAQTQGLGAEEGARMSALAGAGARQTAQSDRYSQLLSQSLNERTGLAKQSTQNTMDDLTKALQAAQFAAQQRKADQLYQIEQARAEAAAAMRAAAARGGGHGGGYGGSSGQKPMTYAEIRQELKAAQGTPGKHGTFDINGIVNDYLGGANPRSTNQYERQTINQIASNISNGSNIGQEMAHFNNFVSGHQGSWNGYNPDLIKEFLGAAFRGKQTAARAGTPGRPGIDPRVIQQIYNAQFTK